MCPYFVLYYIVYVVRFLHVICVSCANLPQARAGIENQTGRIRKCHKKPTNFGASLEMVTDPENFWNNILNGDGNALEANHS